MKAQVTEYAYVPPGDIFPKWMPDLLTNWTAELNHYRLRWSGMPKDKQDQPNWHGERTDIGFLSQAIRRTFNNSIILQEFPCAKYKSSSGKAKEVAAGPSSQKKKQLKNGRSDLWFDIGVRNNLTCNYYVEAKHRGIDLNHRRSFESSLEAARMDIKDVFDSQLTGRWAVTFFETWCSADIYEAISRSWMKMLWETHEELWAEKGSKRSAALWSVERPTHYRYHRKLHVSPGMLMIIEDSSDKSLKS